MRFWIRLLIAVAVSSWEQTTSRVASIFRRQKNEAEHCCQNHEDAMYRTAMLALKTGKPVVGEVSEDGRTLTTRVLD